MKFVVSFFLIALPISLCGSQKSSTVSSLSDDENGKTLLSSTQINLPRSPSDMSSDWSDSEEAQISPGKLLIAQTKKQLQNNPNALVEAQAHLLESAKNLKSMSLEDKVYEQDKQKIRLMELITLQKIEQHLTQKNPSSKDSNVQIQK